MPGSNGYLEVSANGGLNQMRTGICDMVAIAKHMNVTLVLPELDKVSLWGDPSDFGDIFDTDHFIASLKNSVRIIKELPKPVSEKLEKKKLTRLYMHPGSWSNESYYANIILPLVKKHTVVHLNKTDTRIVNAASLETQRLRCYVNFHALKFTPKINEVGQKLVNILRARGPFLVLHLRYEMDMLAFSGCTEGCTNKEAHELTNLRHSVHWWKVKEIDSDLNRKLGLCPLTPEETVLVLRGLGYGPDTQLYIAAGDIYGGNKRMAALHAAFPNTVRKEKLLSDAELAPFRNRSSQMAALDYLVSVASDVFLPTYYGNMAKVVEGHRRYLGYRKTILLDRKVIVEQIEKLKNSTIDMGEFSLEIRQAHEERTGTPFRRRQVPGLPKEEDYFYANPQECLCAPDSSFATRKRLPSHPQFYS